MRRSIQNALVWHGVLSACLFGWLPQSLANPPVPQTALNSEAGTPPRITVRLDEQSMLRGTVPEDARRTGGQYVVLGQQGRVLHRIRSDERGQFQFGPLKPGDYEIASTQAAAFLRLVPGNVVDNVPAEASIEMSQRAMVARGQNANGPVLHSALMVLVAAAAIALPITLDDDDEPAS